MDFSPQRLSLADGYKNAVRGFINTQELFIDIIKNLSNLKDPSGYVKVIIEGMKETTKQISTVLSVSSNKQLVDGLLFQLNEQIARDWLQPGGPKGKTKFYGLTKLVEDGYISEAYLSGIVSRIGNNVKRIHSSLEEGKASRGKFQDTIRNADWKGLVGGALSTAANLTPFGSVINSVGGFLYKTWDNQNRSSFSKSAPRFQENIGSFYSGQPSGGFGGNTGVQSTVNYDPNSDRFRGSKGQYVSNATGVSALNQDPLFNFFNKNAYFAGWTRDVLRILKDLNGGQEGSGGGNKIGQLAEELLGLGALRTAWGKLKSVFKGPSGASNAGQGVAKAAPKAFNFNKVVTSAAADTMIGAGAIGITALMTGSLIKAWSEEAMSYSKLADANDAEAFRQFLKVNNMNREKKGLPPTINPHSSMIPILAELVAEVKKGNEHSKKTSTQSTGTNTQRPIYNDIGDTTTQLLNVGVVGNPRK